MTEVKLSVKFLRAAIARGKKGAAGLVKVVKTAKKNVQGVRENIRRSKAEFKELAAQQRSQEKAEQASQKQAQRAAKQARAEARSVQNALYRDSRTDPRQLYSVAGNLREKIPTLARGFLNPGNIGAGISAFGEGIAGITQAAPFFAFAGGFIALLKPVIEDLDRKQKERIATAVSLEIEIQADRVFEDRFRNDPRFAIRATNEAIESFLAVDSEYKRAGWVNEDLADFEGF